MHDNGTCVDDENSYTCQCIQGYTGQNCEIDINECESEPCLHNGSCTDEVNGYTCLCESGYTGNNCETDIDDCENVVCANQGTCKDRVNGYTCLCKPGYTGQLCEIVPCASSPCVRYATCRDLDDGYICTCGPSSFFPNPTAHYYKYTPSFCSPGYPNGYYPNSKLQWNIQAGTGSKNELNFSEFAVEENVDVVYVREGLPEEEQFFLGELSGSIDIGSEYYYKYLAETLSQPISTSTNMVSILLIADSSIHEKGFCVSYVTVT